MVTIVLAEDHHLVRQGIRSLIEIESDFVVIGESCDGLETLELVQSTKPDVLVLDLMMPHMNGLEVISEINQSLPQTRIVVLSMYSNEAYVLEALRNGAIAYVLKTSTYDELTRAIREAIAGRRYLSSPLSERAIESYIEKTEEAKLDPYETLTLREREVMKLAAEGYTNAQIASKLFLSWRTIETHRSSLMRKLGLRNQTALVRFAINRGVLPENDSV